MEREGAFVLSINVSKGGIPKRPIESVRITSSGLEGDGHNHAKHYHPIQAVCLQDIEKLEELSLERNPLRPGAAGENLTVKKLNVNTLPLGTVLKFSGGVVLEISKVRKPCYVMDAIDNRLKSDALGRHGMYARVLREGMVRKNDRIDVVYSSSATAVLGTEVMNG